MRGMSQIVLGFIVVGVIAGAGSIFLYDRAYPPTTANLSPPAPPAEPATPAPQPPAPAPEVTASPPPASVLPPAPPPPTTLPELPTREVPEQPVNAVPPGVAPTPAVTIEDKNGRTVTRPGAPARPASPEPSTAALPSLSPTQTAASPPTAATVIGPASATGTISLVVKGQGIRLFGVSPPANGDRCVSARGTVSYCADVTRDVLAQRLAQSTSVTCRLSPNSRPSDPERVCLDGSGVDIAGYLVAEGLVLADPVQGGDYRGAQSIAKSYRKGLWAYR
jgi:endonuclease YncB( thermonuclease family)